MSKDNKTVEVNEEELKEVTGGITHIPGSEFLFLNDVFKAKDGSHFALICNANYKDGQAIEFFPGLLSSTNPDVILRQNRVD